MSRFSPARYWSVVKKEIIQVKRDRPSLAIALAMPLMMLFLFGYAVNPDGFFECPTDRPEQRDHDTGGAHAKAGPRPDGASR